MSEYLNAVVKQVPADKIYLGVSRVAYDWELPYRQGESLASSLTYPSALSLANQYGSEILYDEKSHISYFNYRILDQEHVVWLMDARYANAIFNLISEHDLAGISIWTIMFFFQIYLLINMKYDIEKLLPVE